MNNDMDQGRLGVPRPFTEDGEGPLGVNRPLVQDGIEQLEVELEDLVEDEKQADIKYHRIIIKLEELNFDDLSRRIRDMRNQEINHKDELRNILNEIRRKTS